MYKNHLPLSTVTLSCSSNFSSDESEDAINDTECNNYFSEVSREHFSDEISYECHNFSYQNLLLKTENSLQQLGCDIFLVSAHLLRKYHILH